MADQPSLVPPKAHQDTDLVEELHKTLGSLSKRNTTSQEDVEPKPLSSETLLNAIWMAHKEFLDLGVEVTHHIKSRILFSRLLTEILNLMTCEYGFIGEIKYDEETKVPYLHTLAISDISWTDELHAFFESRLDQGLEFRDLDNLFGECILTKTTILSNDPKSDKRAKGVPQGHPPLNSFLGIPFLTHSGGIIGMVGIANRPGGFTEANKTFLRPFVTTATSLLKGLRAQRSQRIAEEELRKLNAHLEELVETRTQQYIGQRDKAEKMDMAKSFFLATMSHEIRTPLNSVLGHAELLKETALTKEQEEYVNSIRTSGDTLLSTLTDILDLTKIEAGEIELTPSSTHLWSVLGQLRDVEALKAHEKGLDLQFSVSQGTATHVIIDAARLKQVLVNLIHNAIKFTSTGSIKVSITQEDPQVNDFTFAVADTGAGMNEEEVSHLFKPFSQTEIGRRRFDGTGLGLFISRSIILALRSDIKVESEKGVGTTFTFTLKLPIDTEMETEGPREALALHSDGIVLYHICSDKAFNESLQQMLSEFPKIRVENSPSWRSFSESVNNDTAGYFKLRLASGEKCVILIQRVALLEAIEAIGNFRSECAGVPVMVTCSLAGRSSMTSLESSYPTILTEPIKQETLVEALLTHTAPVNKSPELPRNAESNPCVHYKILVVDDNRMNQVVMSKMLTKCGYKYDVVDNGMQAVDHVCRDHDYHCVLMDLHMPQLGGIGATQKIREYEIANNVNPQIPIIALTADVMQGELERCLESGMNEYLSKPVKKHVLATTLEKVLGLSD